MLKSGNQFVRNVSGSLASMVAISAPLLFGAAGIAVDYARFNQTQASLQGLADSAAVAAVSSLAVANTAGTTASAVAKSHVKKSAEDTAWQRGSDGIAVETDIDGAASKVKVTLSQEWTPMLAHLISDLKTPVVATSTATLVGSGKVCVVALEVSSNKAIHMDDSARLTGNQCGVFSNSTHTVGIMVDKAATLSASKVCSAGGALVKKKGFVSPSVTEDCPTINDPVAGRAAPAASSCDHNGLVVDGASNTTLNPGVYCGGLTIRETANVTLMEGTFVIKDGPLLLQDAATMTGEGVGFYLTGSKALFDFEPGTRVSLEAQKGGDMAGLLFYENPANAAGVHKISSADAKNLLGTIYLPASTLEIAAVASVAGESAYTALIVNKLKVFEGPNVTLNSNYDATDVPVPPGLIGGKVVLTN